VKIILQNYGIGSLVRRLPRQSYQHVVVVL
jgi:hypothetical protein